MIPRIESILKMLMKLEGCWLIRKDAHELSDYFQATQRWIEESEHHKACARFASDHATCSCGRDELLASQIHEAPNPVGVADLTHAYFTAEWRKVFRPLVCIADAVDKRKNVRPIGDDFAIFELGIGNEKCVLTVGDLRRARTLVRGV